MPKDRLDADHFFYEGPSLFMYVVNHKDAPCRVTFKMPEGWKVATGLAFKDGVYSARDYDTFIDQPSMLGFFELLEFKEGGAQFQIAACAPVRDSNDFGIAFKEGLTVNDLTCNFDVSAPWLNRVIERKPRQFVRAVDDISFTVPMGGCLSLVGESGCGKSTVARLVTGLYRASEGEVRFAPGKNGEPLSAQMIFQDPYASLNPRWRVRNIIAEPLRELRFIHSALYPVAPAELVTGFLSALRHALCTRSNTSWRAK